MTIENDPYWTPELIKRAIAAAATPGIPVPANVRPAYRIVPTEDAADAFWKYWRENGETHKHGYYESTWGAINAALAVAGVRYIKNESSN